MLVFSPVFIFGPPLAAKLPNYTIWVRTIPLLLLIGLATAVIWQLEPTQVLYKFGTLHLKNLFEFTMVTKAELAL